MLPDLRFVIGATMATAVLGFTAIGLVTAARLTGHAKVGPIASSRTLPFDSSAHWNQFYHADSAERFEILARKRAVARSSIDPSDSPAAEGPSSVAIEAPAERALETSLRAAAPAAAVSVSLALAVRPSTDAAAPEPAPRIIAMQDDLFDARVQAPAAERERHDAPPQSPARMPAIAAEGPVGPAPLPPVAAAARDDLVPRVVLAPAQSDAAPPTRSPAAAATDAPSAEKEPAPPPFPEPPVAAATAINGAAATPDPIAQAAPQTIAERDLEQSAPAAAAPAVRPAAKRPKLAPPARAALSKPPPRARKERPVRRHVPRQSYATQFSSQYYQLFSTQRYAPRRAGRRQFVADPMGQPF